VNCCVTKLEQLSRPFSIVTQQKNAVLQAGRIWGRMVAQKPPAPPKEWEKGGEESVPQPL